MISFRKFLIVTFFVEMYNCLNFIDYINTRLIISRSELLRFTFNPFGVGASGAHFPQVAPVAIHIQPLSGLRCMIPNPQVAPVAIHIQPLQGWQIRYQQNPL